MPEVTVYSLGALLTFVIFMVYAIKKIDPHKLRKISPFELNMYRD